MKRRLTWLSHVVLRGFSVTSRGPISWKFPKPVDDPPGPPCEDNRKTSSPNLVLNQSEVIA